LWCDDKTDAVALTVEIFNTIFRRRGRRTAENRANAEDPGR
jgi:hypothetical protein